MQYVEANQKWLEDASIRLLCVFALDRFADFVSDQVHTYRIALIFRESKFLRIAVFKKFHRCVFPMRMAVQGLKF